MFFFLPDKYELIFGDNLLLFVVCLSIVAYKRVVCSLENDNCIRQRNLLFCYRVNGSFDFLTKKIMIFMKIITADTIAAI